MVQPESRYIVTPESSTAPDRRAFLSAFLLLLYWLAFQYIRVPELAIFGGRRIEHLRALLAVVFSDYYPRLWLGSPVQASTADRLGLLAVVAFIILWAFAAGWLAIRRFWPDAAWTRLETALFSTAVGLNLISTGVLAVGLLGGLGWRWLFAAAAMGTFVVAAVVWRRIPMTTMPAELAASGPSDWIGRRWLWWVVPLTLVILLGGLLPPSDFDVREYHLQAPKEFYQSGRIAFAPHNVYANMPLGSEMFALLAMVLLDDPWRGALVGKTLIAAFALLGAAGLYAGGRRFFSVGAGVAAALLFLSTPWVLYESLHGLIDIAMGCYLFLAIYAWLLGPPDARGRFLLVGYLAGAAAACKYPALLFGVLPLTAWLVWELRAAGWRTFVRRLTVFLLALVAGCGLWLGKNAYFTGNPTYPLLYSVFGGRGWSAEQDAQWNAVHRPEDFSGAALARDLGRVALTSDWLSPLTAPLALIGLCCVRRRRLLASLGLFFTVAIAAWWLFTHRIDRFWIPLLPLPCLMAGAGAVWSSERTWRWLVAALLTITLLGAVLLGASETFGSGHLLVDLGRLRTDTERIGSWRAYFNTHVKQGKLLLVGEAQVFDYEVPIEYSTCFNRNLLETLAQGHASREIQQELRDRQITCLYVNWSEIARYRRPGNYGFSDFFQPALFDRLVADGVLAPLADLPDSGGRGYRVIGSKPSR